jgi:hypothetical protein
LEESGTAIGSIVRPTAKGNADDITINTSSLSLSKAFLATSTFGDGDAGNITINADKQVVVDDTNISSGPLSLE